MIKHHPNTNILFEYAAGSLGLAQSIAVAAHLHFCPHCRQQVGAFEELGAAVMLNADDPEVSDELFDSIMQKVESEDSMPAAAPKQADQPHDSLRGLPSVVAQIIGKKSNLQWKKLSKSLQIAPLKTGQHRCEVSLHKINAGGKVMSHDHKGLEYTLVLKGSFSDENGVYHPGDFLLKQPGEEHRPYATANRDCLCLTVVEAPVKFTGIFSRLLNPLLRLQPQ